jgi:hypothetical protein
LLQAAAELAVTGLLPLLDLQTEMGVPDTFIPVLCRHLGCVQIPIGAEDSLRGLVDLIDRRAFEFHGAHGERIVGE